MKDRYNRNIEYMRISVTDLCNLRCVYCMPNGIEHVLPMHEILTFEEILRVVEAAVSLGITKFKITGGEPLVRRGIMDLVRMLTNTKGVSQVTMTSNGVLLGEMAKGLKEAGLASVNVSLDSLHPHTFKEITGFDALNQVLFGIQKAREVGIKTKINVVLQKGRNEDAWKDLALLSKEEGLEVRFIEMMPIGYGDEQKGVSNTDLLDLLEQEFGKSEVDTTSYGNGPANYVRFPGFLASIGFISAMHGTFCDACNRIRLSSTGMLKPCLCFSKAVDLRKILRGNYEDTVLIERMAAAIFDKPRAHQFLEKENITERRKMHEIGG